MKVISKHGDIDPITHGGGMVLENGEGYITLEWTEGPVEPENFGEPPDEEEGNLFVYQISLDQDTPFEWMSNWPSNIWDDVSRSCGMEEKELIKLAKSRDYSDQALVYQYVAGYCGWYELDQYPFKVSQKDLTTRWHLD